MTGNHLVAVIGGACSGSEIASRLRASGMEVILFEQNSLPYGKIEDGLPRWHQKLQTKEMNAIDEKLHQEGIHYVPECKIGTRLGINTLVHEWQLPLIVLANGAWNDRALKVEGSADITDDSLVYQNPFVYWFNHYHEKNFEGKRYQVRPGTVVVGGGLASIDVAKICQFELLRAFLEERGHRVDMVELDHYGIYKALETRGFSAQDINWQPARLFYRKRIKDMPLVPLGDDPSEEKLQKAEKVREKLIQNAVARYGFEVYPLHAPVRIHGENGTLTGVTFKLNRYEGGRFVDSGQERHIPATMLVSSIGSIPEPIRDIPMDGELYRWNNRHTGEVQSLETIYCVGNAITGRGNIKDSAKNAQRLGIMITDGLSGQNLDYEKWFQTQAEEARAHVEKMLDRLKKVAPMDPAQRRNILDQVKTFQTARGYGGNYMAWRNRIMAAR